MQARVVRPAIASMDVVRAVLGSAQDIMHRMLGESARQGNPRFHPGSLVSLQEVNALVGITGEVRGKVNLGVETETALKLVSELMGSPQEELDDIGLSALQELTNIIAGNALHALKVLGAHSDVTPPKLLLGKDLRASWHQTKSICVPLLFSFGEVHLTVGIQPLS